MPVLGVIPARLGSSRLARKPLQTLGGSPLIITVYRRAQTFAGLDEIVVATDAPEVAQVVEQAGGRAVLTSSAHNSGTERVAEVATSSEFRDFDRFVNIQGDEPFLPHTAVIGSLNRLDLGNDIGTAAAPLDRAFADAPNRVKVVCDRRGNGLYFSRARIPFESPHGEPASYWQHLGVYAYGREALERWVSATPTELENAERLEQLRALDIGLTIGVTKLSEPALPGIDTPEDLEFAERFLTLAANDGVTTP